MHESNARISPYALLSETLNDILSTDMQYIGLAGLGLIDPAQKLSLFQMRMNFMYDYLHFMFQANAKNPKPIDYPNWQSEIAFHADLLEQTEELNHDVEELKELQQPLMPCLLAQKDDLIKTVVESTNCNDAASIGTLRQHFILMHGVLNNNN